MTAYRAIPTILLALSLAIAIPTVLYFRKPPKSELTASDRELINFSNKPVAMSSPQPPATFSGLASPVKTAPNQVRTGIANIATPDTVIKSEPVAAAKGEPVNPKMSPPRSLASRPSVSVIYSVGSSRMAIVNGQVVQEGSAIDSGQIVKIEETRILLRKSGKDIWLTIE